MLLEKDKDSECCHVRDRVIDRVSDRDLVCDRDCVRVRVSDRTCM